MSKGTSPLSTVSPRSSDNAIWRKDDRLTDFSSKARPDPWGIMVHSLTVDGTRTKTR